MEDPVLSFQTKLKQIEKDLLPTITYSTATTGKLRLVTCPEITYSITTDDDKIRSSLSALMLGSDFFFYPVINFYSDRGLKEISFVIIWADQPQNIRELGDAYLDYRDISKLGKALFKRFTPAEIYDNIETILNLLVKMVTKDGSLVSEYSNQSYFGLSCSKDKFPEDTLYEEELDLRIRADFTGKIPMISSTIATEGCQLI